MSQNDTTVHMHKTVISRQCKWFLYFFFPDSLTKKYEHAESASSAD